MSYSKFFQGLAIGLTAFTLLWLNDSLLKKGDNKNGVSESWDNVGKYLNKAIKDYEKTSSKKA